MLKSFIYLKRIADATVGIDDVSTIIEIGANKCTESVDFYQNYPRANIYSFECNPETIPICRKAIVGYSRIHLIEKAVSSKEGKIDFYPIDTSRAITSHTDGNPGASSVFKRNENTGFIQERLPQRNITVESITLERFMAERDIRSIDILWLDAQGAELMILKSLGENISNVGIVQCEVEFIEEYLSQPLYVEIRSFLEEKGFVFCGFSEEWYPHAADAIFVRYDILSKTTFMIRTFSRIMALLPVKPLWARRISHRLRNYYTRT